MANSQNNPYKLWGEQRCCHPNAPAGGGGPGNFTSAGPANYHDARGGLPHPNSPAGRRITPDQIQSHWQYERVECLLEACRRAKGLAAAAVYDETGFFLGPMIQDFLPGLLKMFILLGITTAVGAGLGGAIGALLGGIGAAPGTVLGSELGLEVGTAILTWFGLGFLVMAIGEGIGVLTSTLLAGIREAWQAAEQGSHRNNFIDKASRDLAKCVGIFFRLILQGVLALVLKKGALASSRGVAVTVRGVANKGAQIAADDSIAEVSALLKKSKLPNEFAAWVERNWEDLKRNPKLRGEKTEPEIRTTSSSTASTPSELKSTEKDLGTPPHVTNSEKLLNNERFVDISKKRKGERPQPSDYLTKQYIDEHLAKFNDGAVKIVPQNTTGTIGPKEGTFVLPKSFVENCIKQSNGSVQKLEELLSLDKGYLGENPMLIKMDKPSGLRIPSGNEPGANSQWVPGGFTGAGTPEAVVDQIQPGSYTIEPVFSN